MFDSESIQRSQDGFISSEDDEDHLSGPEVTAILIL